MKMIEYLYPGMLLISVVLIFFAIRQYRVTKDLMANGIKTTAKVIELIEDSDGDGDIHYSPVFEYTDWEGKVVTFTSKVSTSPSPYIVGDYEEIVYSKDNDTRKVVSFWGLYRWTLILLSIASPLLIIGGGYILYSRG